MKSYPKIFILLLSLLSQGFAQVNPGARQIALAHSDLSYSRDPFSLFNNPSGLALGNNRSVSIFYSPAPFDVKELATAYAAYAEPTSFGNFSAGFSIYGFELYKETKFALGYGFKLQKNFSVGAALIYQNTSIKNYGNKRTILLNLGGIVAFNNYSGFGFAIENVIRSSVSDESNQLPTVFWGGFHLVYHDDFIFSSAIRKEIGYNPSVRLGVEYIPLEFIFIRIGAQSEPNSFCGGFGVLYQFLQFDYAISNHPDLGLTHQFGLQISISK